MGVVAARHPGRSKDTAFVQTYCWWGQSLPETEWNILLQLCEYQSGHWCRSISSSSMDGSLLACGMHWKKVLWLLRDNASAATFIAPATCLDWIPIWWLAVKKCRQRNKCIIRWSFAVPPARASTTYCLTWPGLCSLPTLHPTRLLRWPPEPSLLLQYEYLTTHLAIPLGTTDLYHLQPRTPMRQMRLRWLCEMAMVVGRCIFHSTLTKMMPTTVGQT